MKGTIDDVISIRDFERDGLMHVLEHAEEMERGDCSGILDGYVLGIMFIEPSTRTRLSFSAAMMKLGGQVLDFGNPERSSFKKGESLCDTIRTFSGYCDVIAVRHPWEGTARLASEIVDVPVINAGDGANQHPTQTFLDLYTIRKTCGRIEDLNIGFLGDLRFSRTVHSLAEALSHFSGGRCFISPDALRVPRYVLDGLRDKGMGFEEVSDLSEVISDLDVLYCTRIQEERFADRMEYEQVKDSYRIDRKFLEGAGVKDSLKIMHPLPRVDELRPDVDETPYAVYFEQARNGVPIRQALLGMVLGEV